VYNTFTGVKLNNNRNQYSRPAIVWQCNQSLDLSLNYTVRKIFGLCTFYEKIGFIHFAQHTSKKSNYITK